MALQRDFFIAKPTHSQAVFTLWVYIPTHLPQSHAPFPLTLNQSPKDIAGSDKLFDTDML